MVDFGKLADRAKKLVEHRGGMDSVKEDAGELRDIAHSGGSITDKAKRAAEALRGPGAHPEASGPGEAMGDDSGSERAGETMGDDSGSDRAGEAMDDDAGPEGAGQG